MDDYEMDENVPQRKISCNISNGLISWRLRSTPDFCNSSNVTKTSVDSGLEMGNDSNGSTVMQNDNDPSNLTIPIPFGNVTKISTGYSRQFNDKEYNTNNETCTIEEIDQPASSLSEDVSEWKKRRFMSTSDRHLLNLRKIPSHATWKQSVSERTKKKKEWLEQAFFAYHEQKLRRGASPKEVFFANYERKLCLAASINHVENVERMLNIGVSPNCRDSMGCTPLQIARHRGYSDIVNLLLKHGADAKLCDTAGTAPFQTAITCGNKSSITPWDKAVVCQPSLRFKIPIVRRFGSNTNDSKSQVNDNVSAFLDVGAHWSNNSRGFDQQVEALSNVCSRLSFSNASDECQGSS